ncbi:MAG: RluA family pseudouridine synthase [Sphingomonas sp.]|uniref:Ribosomal large subunit pseudouridine synthase D n=2 Tax=Sphingomonas adhaesiva TaxID=28212 RepID=A0A2A4I8P1_9SPHN|nr:MULTISPECIES: RluA family pseudouridine synthase [Sphingomonas]PCG14855.1 RNA pseudouridine synthase [Sphingomonas adhaesiva]PZU78539.1 MAG: RluA family pseudouridine synthase [Sphingomonas sp.]
MSGGDDNVRQFTVDSDDDGIRVDRWFKRHLEGTSFTTVAKWARTGQLRVDGARVGPGDRLQAGQVLRVPPAEPVRTDARPQRQRPPLSDDEATFAREMVIHKDAQALVLNKPPGLATQGGTKTVQHVDGLLDALQYEAEGRPKLVHRLDKDTSGALLVARTARAAAFFAKSFSGRSAKKVYWALVVGVPSIDDGTIDLPIAKQPGTGGEKMHIDEAEGSPARSRYRVIERAGNRAAWVELQPFTGRTHQLRVHMAAIGHPIVGDGKYGGPAAFLTGGISRKMHLHARRIRVDHPDGGEIDVTAELPTHFAESLAGLGFEAMAGDMMPLDTFTPPTREEKKAKARAHAKSVRKERRGERRGRGGDDAPRGGGGGGGSGGGGRPRTGARAAAGPSRGPARPAGPRGAPKR